MNEFKPLKIKLLLKTLLIALFLVAGVFATVKYGPYITRLASKPRWLKHILASYGFRGVFVFILLQVLQVVAAAIPGEVIQLAGGYIYGIWLGTLYSLAGILLGSVIVFYISRLLGYSIVKAFVSQKNLEKLNFIMNSSKSEIAMFILFLIPGMPKDILTYIAGLTPVKPVRFFVIITAGRLPALFASSCIGYSAGKGDYAMTVALSVAAVVLFAAGVLLKDRIIAILKNRDGP